MTVNQANLVNAKASTGKDVYVEAVDLARQNYQLEPSLTIEDKLWIIPEIIDDPKIINGFPISLIFRKPAKIFTISVVSVLNCCKVLTNFNFKLNIFKNAIPDTNTAKKKIS